MTTIIAADFYDYGFKFCLYDLIIICSLSVLAFPDILTVAFASRFELKSKIAAAITKLVVSEDIFRSEVLSHSNLITTTVQVFRNVLLI